MAIMTAERIEEARRFWESVERPTWVVTLSWYVKKRGQKAKLHRVKGYVRARDADGAIETLKYCRSLPRRATGNARYAHPVHDLDAKLLKS